MKIPFLVFVIVATRIVFAICSVLAASPAFWDAGCHEIGHYLVCLSPWLPLLLFLGHLQIVEMLPLHLSYRRL